MDRTCFKVLTFSEPLDNTARWAPDNCILSTATGLRAEGPQLYTRGWYSCGGLLFHLHSDFYNREQSPVLLFQTVRYISYCTNAVTGTSATGYPVLPRDALLPFAFVEKDNT